MAEFFKYDKNEKSFDFSQFSEGLNSDNTKKNKDLWKLFGVFDKDGNGNIDTKNVNGVNEAQSLFTFLKNASGDDGSLDDSEISKMLDDSKLEIKEKEKAGIIDAVKSFLLGSAAGETSFKDEAGNTVKLKYEGDKPVEKNVTKNGKTIEKSTFTYVENGVLISTEREGEIVNTFAKSVDNYGNIPDKDFLMRTVEYADGSTVMLMASETGMSERLMSKGGNMRETVYSGNSLSEYEQGILPKVYENNAYANGTVSESTFESGKPLVKLVQITVNPGETLSELAQKFGTTVSKIQKQNDIEDVNRVKPGKVLVLEVKLDKDETVVSQRLTQNQITASNYQKAFERVVTRENITTETPQKFKNLTEAAKYVLKQQGINNPSQTQINDCICELTILNSKGDEKSVKDKQKSALAKINKVNLTYLDKDDKYSSMLQNAGFKPGAENYELYQKFYAVRKSIYESAFYFTMSNKLEKAQELRDEVYNDNAPDHLKKSLLANIGTDEDIKNKLVEEGRSARKILEKMDKILAEEGRRANKYEARDNVKYRLLVECGINLYDDNFREQDKANGILDKRVALNLSKQIYEYLAERNENLYNSGSISEDIVNSADELLDRLLNLTGGDKQTRKEYIESLNKSSEYVKFLEKLDLRDEKKFNEFFKIVFNIDYDKKKIDKMLDYVRKNSSDMEKLLKDRDFQDLFKQAFNINLRSMLADIKCEEILSHITDILIMIVAFEYIGSSNMMQQFSVKSASALQNIGMTGKWLQAAQSAVTSAASFSAYTAAERLTDCVVTLNREDNNEKFEKIPSQILESAAFGAFAGAWGATVIAPLTQQRTVQVGLDEVEKALKPGTKLTAKEVLATYYKAQEPIIVSTAGKVAYSFGANVAGFTIYNTAKDYVKNPEIAKQLGAEEFLKQEFAGQLKGLTTFEGLKMFVGFMVSGKIGMDRAMSVEEGLDPFESIDNINVETLRAGDGNIYLITLPNGKSYTANNVNELTGCFINIMAAEMQYKNSYNPNSNTAGLLGDGKTAVEAPGSNVSEEVNSAIESYALETVVAELPEHQMNSVREAQSVNKAPSFGLVENISMPQSDLKSKEVQLTREDKYERLKNLCYTDENGNTITRFYDSQAKILAESDIDKVMKLAEITYTDENGKVVPRFDIYDIKNLVQFDVDKVMRLAEITYTDENGKVVPRFERYYIADLVQFDVDKVAKLAETTYTDENGKVVPRFEIYNIENLMQFDVDKVAKLAETTYTDENGRVVPRFDIYDIKNLVQFDVDKVAKLAEMAYTDENGKVVPRFEIYDIKNLVQFDIDKVMKLAEITYTDENGKVVPRFEIYGIKNLVQFDIDKVMKLAEMTYTDENGRVVPRFKAYDIVDLVQFDIDKVMKLAEMAYTDENGKVVPRFAAYDIENLVQFDVDKVAKLTEMTYTDENGKVVPRFKIYYIKNLMQFDVDKVAKLAEITITKDGKTKLLDDYEIKSFMEECSDNVDDLFKIIDEHPEYIQYFNPKTIVKYTDRLDEFIKHPDLLKSMEKCGMLNALDEIFSIVPAEVTKQSLGIIDKVPTEIREKYQHALSMVYTYEMGHAIENMPYDGQAILDIYNKLSVYSETTVDRIIALITMCVRDGKYSNLDYAAREIENGCENADIIANILRTKIDIDELQTQYSDIMTSKDKIVSQIKMRLKDTNPEFASNIETYFKDDAGKYLMFTVGLSEAALINNLVEVARIFSYVHSKPQDYINGNYSESVIKGLVEYRKKGNESVLYNALSDDEKHTVREINGDIVKNVDDNFGKIYVAISATDVETIKLLLDRRFSIFSRKLAEINGMNSYMKENLSDLIRNGKRLNKNGQPDKLTGQQKIDLISIVQTAFSIDPEFDFSKYKTPLKGKDFILDIKALREDILKEIMCKNGISENEYNSLNPENMKWDTRYISLLANKPVRDNGELASVIREASMGNFKKYISSPENIHGAANIQTEKTFKNMDLDYEQWLTGPAERNISVGDKTYTIKLWNREPQESLFDGTYTTCCTALDGGNGGSMANYMLNTAINVVEVKDSRGQIIGMSRCYMAEVDGVKTLVIENIEVNNAVIKELKNANEMTEFAKGIFEYMKDYADAVGGKGTQVYMSTSYHKIGEEPFEDLTKITGKVKFIGTISKQEIYLNTYGRYVDPAKLPDQEQDFHIIRSSND